MYITTLPPARLAAEKPFVAEDFENGFLFSALRYYVVVEASVESSLATTNNQALSSAENHLLHRKRP